MELSGEGTSAVLSGNTLRDGQSGVGLLIHRGAHAVASDNEIGGHPIANVEVGFFTLALTRTLTRTRTRTLTLTTEKHLVLLLLIGRRGVGRGKARTL